MCVGVSAAGFVVTSSGGHFTACVTVQYGIGICRIMFCASFVSRRGAAEDVNEDVKWAMVTTPSTRTANRTDDAVDEKDGYSS